MNLRELLARADAAKRAMRTPEQQKRLEEVNARNDAIQRAAIKPPKSGTFGKGKPDG